MASREDCVYGFEESKPDPMSSSLDDCHPEVIKWKTPGAKIVKTGKRETWSAQKAWFHQNFTPA
jgi:hypothetical protein